MSPAPGSIYLVRHGEAEASWGQSPDPGLSQLGGEQAETAAQRLAGLVGEGATLVSSPLQRARETARPLAGALGLELRIDERFREIPSPVPLEERQNWLRSFMAGQWSGQDDGLVAWRGDILRALTELPPQTVVFTHFLVINTVVGHLQGRDDTLVFWPANASITQLEQTGTDLRLLSLGEEMDTHVN